jgi:hypothetical protein
MVSTALAKVMFDSILLHLGICGGDIPLDRP